MSISGSKAGIAMMLAAGAAMAPPEDTGKQHKPAGEAGAKNKRKKRKAKRKLRKQSRRK